ncbi:hypothetical protein, partial [Escherichia coli]|uniref:hypothetical protein n=1 Tax=Escherichia coli TaxID=562 RepID=UPI001BDB74A8
VETKKKVLVENRFRFSTNTKYYRTRISRCLFAFIKKKKKCWQQKVSPTLDIIEPKYFGSIIYGTDESELILQPHFHFRY